MTVARHSCECRATFVRMSLSFIFSPDSREVFARLSRDRRATCDIRTSVAKISHCKFAKISRRQVHDTRTNVARQSRDVRAKYFGEKIRIKFFNMLKNFVTQENSHDTRTNVVRKSATKFAKQLREIRMPVRY